MLIHEYNADMDLQVTLVVDGHQLTICDVCGEDIPSHTLFLRVVAVDEIDVVDNWHLGCADLGYVDELPRR